MAKKTGGEVGSCEIKLLSVHLNGKALASGPLAHSLVDKATTSITQRANAAGHGSYAGDTITGKKGFPHGLIHTADKYACYGERKHNTLAKAVGGG